MFFKTTHTLTCLLPQNVQNEFIQLTKKSNFNKKDLNIVDVLQDRRTDSDVWAGAVKSVILYGGPFI